MRLGFLLFAALLASCGQPASQAPAAQPGAAVTPTSPAAITSAPASPPWFFCDGIDAPVLYLFADNPQDRRVHFVEYDKRTGAVTRSLDLDVGDGDGAAGSVYTPLSNHGAEFGHVREVNTGALETPGAAYTQLFSSVQIEGRDVQCRWLPRTRVAAFTGRRSFVISEDADGDLIYTTYDFGRATAAQPVDLSNNGRSTAFSVEVRNGSENVGANGSDFTFAGRDGYSYHINVDANGAGQLQVQRNGAVVQTEPLIAALQGQAEQD